MNEELIWIEYAFKHNYKYVIILKDLEDKDYYPIYVSSEKDLIQIQDNIISETKVKIIKIVDIQKVYKIDESY